MATTWKFAGTISHGTLIERDLAEAFTDAAKAIAPEREEEIDALYREFIEAEDAEDFETAGYILHEQIYDLMDELAPEGYYFGSHPGDGSDFGYWENEEEETEAPEGWKEVEGDPMTAGVKAIVLKTIEYHGHKGFVVKIKTGFTSIGSEWYTGYVRLNPEDEQFNFYRFNGDTDFESDCHGGITFANLVRAEKNEFEPGQSGFYVGFDLCHAGDSYRTFSVEYVEQNVKLLIEEIEAYVAKKEEEKCKYWQPKYRHDCDECEFFGRYEYRDEVYDLYACGDDTVIARFGNKGHQYSSLLASAVVRSVIFGADGEGPLVECLRRLSDRIEVKIEKSFLNRQIAKEEEQDERR